MLVRVQASCVNPIDVKRAAGYGRRLLGLKGAASFPLVLGNDFAGTVEATGAGVSRFAPGQRVPDREALEVLAAGSRERRFSLSVGISAPLEDADAAFAHVAAGKPGRAVLLP